MNMVLKWMGLTVIAFAFAACDKKPEGETGAAAAKSATTPATAAKPTVAPTATATETAKAEAITPTEKEPFEALTFKPKGGKDANGWAIFEVVNASTKAVTFANVYAFAYDKDGKYVAHTKPLSWNPGKLAPGTKSSWDLTLGDREAAKVSDTATQFEVCYDSIRFDGEANAVTGKGCDAKRPLGGVKSAKK